MLDKVTDWSMNGIGKIQGTLDKGTDCCMTGLIQNTLDEGTD